MITKSKKSPEALEQYKMINYTLSDMELFFYYNELQQLFSLLTIRLVKYRKTNVVNRHTTELLSIITRLPGIR